MKWSIAVLIVAAILVFVALDTRGPKDRTTSTPASSSASYENPVDGTTIEANWRTYGEGGAVSAGLSGEPEHRAIILLSSDEVFKRNVTTEELVTFMRGVEGALDEATSATSASYRVLVQVTLSPQHAPAYEFFTVGEAPQADRQRILDALKVIAPLHTTREPVKLQLWYFTDHR